MAVSRGQHDKVDVLIVGAGPAGAVCALGLARAGLKVKCLEQGDWPDPTLYRGAEDDGELVGAKGMSPDPAVRGAPADYPVHSLDGNLIPLMFNAVGGSSVVWNANFPRLTPGDFKVRSIDGVADDWPLTYEQLVPFYRRAERDFGVSGLAGDPAYPYEEDQYPLPPLPIGAHGRRLAAAHNRLGWHWWPAANAIPSAAYDGRPPCAQWGTCPVGCPEGAKATADVTHWPAAIAEGADLVTGARVRRMVTDSRGLVTGAEYVDRRGDTHMQRCDFAILAANGVGNPRLLFLSAGSGCPDGLANSSGLVGRRLMVHPFTVVTGMFDDELETWQGQFGAAVNSFEFYPSDHSRGFVRGAKWSLVPTGGPVTNALGGRSGTPVWGPGHHAAFRRRFGRSASWAIMGEDLPEDANCVTLDDVAVDSDGLPAAAVRYTPSENTRRLLSFSVERAKESMLAAGAHSVEASQRKSFPGWHLMGTTVMGTDPATSVVDPYGITHDVPNLAVAGSSVFVTAGAVNPTATLAALAHRLVDHLLGRRADIPVPA
jgi:choline dehydrogenase-like flavoprotein